MIHIINYVRQLFNIVHLYQFHKSDITFLQKKLMKIKFISYLQRWLYTNVWCTSGPTLPVRPLNEVFTQEIEENKMTLLSCRIICRIPQWKYTLILNHSPFIFLYLYLDSFPIIDDTWHLKHLTETILLPPINAL